MANVHTIDRSEWSQFENAFEDLKSLRLSHEQRWKDVATYCMRRKETGPIDRGAPLAPRNLIDKTAVTHVSRLGNLLHGYLFNPFAPFFNAHLADRTPSYSERLWFDEVNRKMHRALTGPKAPFRTAIGAALYQSTGLGSAPIFTSVSRGTIIAISVPLWDSWIDENPDTQLVDTFYRRFRKKAWRAAMDYPEAEKIVEAAANEPNKILTFVQAIKPNAGGKVGAVRSQKPFVEHTFSLDYKIRVGQVGGYDDFPVPALRFYRQNDEPYGYGPGGDVLEWAKALNAIEDNQILAMEQNTNPTLLDFTNGMVDIRDRRPGAEIPVDPQIYRMAGVTKPLERLYDPVDLRDSYAKADGFRRSIMEACFTDWMTPNEGPRKTAAEIYDRRDLRLRAMASVVSNMERDFNQLGERFFVLMSRARMLPPPPDSLVGEEIEFEFISPLRQAQNQSEVEQLVRYLELVGAAAAIDPEAQRVPDAEAIAREGGRKLGVPEHLQRSVEEVARERAAEAEAAQAAQELEMANMAATALRDGGQGAANLATAGAQQRGAA